MASITQKYDFIVIGAGIAGLSAAELLQRSGQKVLLLEATDKLCSGASGHQQGWFHTGALYAPMPEDRFFRQLASNIDNILNYYSGFDNMNLKLHNRLAVSRNSGWFHDSLINFCYVKPFAREIPFFKRFVWSLAQLRAQARLAWFETVDFSRDIGPQFDRLTVSRNFKRIRSTNKLPVELEDIAYNLVGHDRTLDSRQIAIDLAKSFLISGGELRMSTKGTVVDTGVVMTSGGNTYTAKEVVVTVGKDTEALSGLGVKVVKSPLLVVKPALFDINWIRMSIVYEDIINHIYHQSPSGGYSVIGNGWFYPIDAYVDAEQVKDRIIRRVFDITGIAIEPSNSALYFGYKSELPSGSQLRNYLYHVIDCDNCVAALPGKFTFAFSLAVALCKRFGIAPSAAVPNLSQPVSLPMVGLPRHRIVADKLDAAAIKYQSEMQPKAAGF